MLRKLKEYKAPGETRQHCKSPGTGQSSGTVTAKQQNQAGMAKALRSKQAEP